MGWGWGCSLLAGLVVDARHGVLKHLQHELRLSDPAPRPSLADTSYSFSSSSSAAAAEIEADALLQLAGRGSALRLGQQLHLLSDLAEEEWVLAEALHRLDEVVEEGDGAAGGRPALHEVRVADLLLRLRDVPLELRPLAPCLVEGLHAAGELEAVVDVHVQEGRELHELRTLGLGLGLGLG